MSDNFKFHKSLFRRRAFLKAGAYASCIGVGLTLSFLIHEEEDDAAQAVMPLLVIPVAIMSVFTQNKDFRDVSIKTSLAFFNSFNRAVSGTVALVFGDSSSAVAPYSNDLSLASKQLENRGESQHDHLFKPLLLANRSEEGRNFHEFRNLPPGKSQIECRPFKVPIGSGQKWMYAHTGSENSEYYTFRCH